MKLPPKLALFKKKKLILFTTAEAKRFGVSPQLLAHYARQGFVEKVSHGVHRLAGTAAVDLESLIEEKLKAIPLGVIGYKTAIRLYGLTEEVPSQIDILVPSNNVPKRVTEDVTLHPVKPSLYKKDVQILRGIPVTSLERTIVDLLRNDEPLSLVLGICREAKSKRRPVDLAKLKRLATAFRTTRKVAALIEALL